MCDRNCEICNASIGNETDRVYYFQNMFLCKKHYLQMYRHGKILNRTIYDPNEYIIHDDYIECICYKKDNTISGTVKLDKNTYDILKNYKIYIRQHNQKKYAAIQIDNKKIMLHRFLMKIHNENFNINRMVDHINGDSLDNRLCNLRICTIQENMCNIRKQNKITGVNQISNGKWVARIMKNYKTTNIGTFNTQEEAIFARIKKEKELYKEFGPLSNLYYILNHPEPIKELQNILNLERNRIG